MSSEARLTLITSPRCGTTSRVTAALYEKKIPFNIREVPVEEKRKSDWFEAINPYRKTPVLDTGKEKIFESIVICEYLEDLDRSIPLLPDDPGERAIARCWIHYCNHGLPDAFQNLTDADMNPTPEGTKNLIRALEKVNRHLRRTNYAGNFWFGSKLGLPDIMYFGVFDVLDFLAREKSLSLEGDLDEFLTWGRQVQSAPAIMRARDLVQYSSDD